jgi:aspartate-semialdehyde dehydrogenase
MRKIPVSILAATGVVGQRFVQLLSDHPWFEIASLVASDSSAGKPYQSACSWKLETPMPPDLAKLTVMSMDEEFPGKLVFSALPGSVAREAEPRLAREGRVVSSNASAHRLDPDVPLLIPEVNADHLELIDKQRRDQNWTGLIVASPNCTTTAIALPLKPLAEAFGLTKVVAVSMQAASGAGYPGVAWMDLHDNVVPLIRGEEEKIEAETRALLGTIEGGGRQDADVEIGAHANRVPVADGHTVCLSIELRQKPTPEEVVEKLRAFTGMHFPGPFPSAPPSPLVVLNEHDRPQPRMDRNVNRGMSVIVGRVRRCPVMNLRMVSMVHNTIRGAAGGAILNAELLYSEGLLA